MKIADIWIAGVICLMLIGCGINPAPIAFGADNCTYCKMKIVDPKFGGELVTSKGKIHKFDALECMIPFMNQSDQAYAFVLGIAYDQPEKLVAVDSLEFVISKTYNSPMGANLAAFTQISPSQQEGEVFNWQSLKTRLSKNR